MNDMEMIRNAYATIEGVTVALEEELKLVEETDELEMVCLTKEAARLIIQQLHAAKIPFVSILEDLKNAQAQMRARTAGIILPDNVLSISN